VGGTPRSRLFGRGIASNRAGLNNSTGQIGTINKCKQRFRKPLRISQWLVSKLRLLEPWGSKDTEEEAVSALSDQAGATTPKYVLIVGFLLVAAIITLVTLSVNFSNTTFEVALS
jgi:hypothetical protein